MLGLGKSIAALSNPCETNLSVPIDFLTDMRATTGIARECAATTERIRWLGMGRVLSTAEGTRWVRPGCVPLGWLLLLLSQKAAKRSIPWSGVVRSCLPCIATNTPNMTRHVPVFGTKRMKTTWRRREEDIVFWFRPKSGNRRSAGVSKKIAPLTTRPWDMFSPGLVPEQGVAFADPCKLFPEDVKASEYVAT